MTDYRPHRPTLRRPDPHAGGPRRHWSLRLFHGLRKATGNFATLAVVLPSAAFGTAFLWDGMPSGFTSPVAPAALSSNGADTEHGRFARCRGSEADCTVDAATFRYQGAMVRLADIEAPGLASNRCAEEMEAAEAGADRLAGLLSHGKFTLVAATGEIDQEGRALRIVTREGKSLGAEMIRAGLADPAGDGRNWCA